MPRSEDLGILSGSRTVNEAAYFLDILRTKRVRQCCALPPFHSCRPALHNPPSNRWEMVTSKAYFPPPPQSLPLPAFPCIFCRSTHIFYYFHRVQRKRKSSLKGEVSNFAKL
ncbi:hypothetical protein M408DRAFT_174096 [Serendipita vermifera MAFF 305830]|uniref:Uncharacterized protein n=1 Tax=Serendipita vermifera MAFF 305830 TaxID=933852 RepID=A0A0C2XDM0_SERVB|nr:hypothetical protein M408DRAFT_174096 [Serendipita vermifera MAFF 305830]